MANMGVIESLHKPNRVFSTLFRHGERPIVGKHNVVKANELWEYLTPCTIQIVACSGREQEIQPWKRLAQTGPDKSLLG